MGDLGKEMQTSLIALEKTKGEIRAAVQRLNSYSIQLEKLKKLTEEAEQDKKRLTEYLAKVKKETAAEKESLDKKKEMHAIDLDRIRDELIALEEKVNQKLKVANAKDLDVKARDLKVSERAKEVAREERDFEREKEYVAEAANKVVEMSEALKVREDNAADIEKEAHRKLSVAERRLEAVREEDLKLQDRLHAADVDINKKLKAHKHSLWEYKERLRKLAEKEEKLAKDKIDAAEIIEDAKKIKADLSKQEADLKQRASAVAGREESVKNRTSELDDEALRLKHKELKLNKVIRTKNLKKEIELLEE